MTKYFKDQKSLVDSEIQDSAQFVPKCREYFEAIIWTIYLEDPSHWIEFGAPAFQPAFQPLDSGRYDKVFFSGQEWGITLGKETKFVPITVRHETRSQEGTASLELITPKAKLNISRKLFIYLTDNFRWNFGTESLYEEARREKLNQSVNPDMRSSVTLRSQL